jgi:hypothetical protein
MSKYNTSFELNSDKTEIKTEGKWMSLGSRNPKNLQLSILVLDFNKLPETTNLLKSIKQNMKISNYEVVFFSNGGNQEYVYNLYKEGFIDKLILNNCNDGCGIATHELFKNAKADYCMYVQNDQLLFREFTQNELDELKKLINNEYTSVDLSGGAGHNDKFSERAYIIKTDTFNNLPIKGYGGPGPYEHDYFWSEAGTSYSFWSQNLKIFHNWPILFANYGFRTIREDLSGNIIERRLF